MKKINKSFCDLSKKDLEKFDKEINKLIQNPKYSCKKCVRVSSEKEYLCKPTKLKNK